MRRALYIDEAASLIEHAEGGKFLANLSRRARKRYLRLVVMTQNPEAFVQDEWGSVVAANAAIKILKKQDRTSVRAVATRFGLTSGEEQRLLTFGVQEALLFAGDRRVLLTVRASVEEHAIITTNPIELADQARAAKEGGGADPLSECSLSPAGGSHMNTFPPLLEVRPARAAGARDLPALETALASLALDKRSPIALELAATTTTRQFLLRAEQAVALRYLEQQVQARYPQAVITPATADPLALAPGEECSVVELCPGAAAYLPLRSWRTRDLLEEGTDPLLGILAAFGSLPVGTRAVAQLALLPASPIWSASSRRYAVEHPLEKEHAQQARRGGTQERSLKDVLLLLPVVVVVLLFYLFHQLLPKWLLQAGVGLLRGQAPHLTASEMFAVVIGSGLLLVALLGGAFVVMVVASRFGASRIYDQRLAAEKTARPAYRVRLRLFVITASAVPLQSDAVIPAVQSVRSRLVHLPGACLRRAQMTLRLWDERGRTPLQAPNLTSIWTRQRAKWRTQHLLARECRARRSNREDLLRMVTASYRQYHLASGGYFLPRRISVRRTSKLLAPPARGWLTRTGWAYDLPHSTHYLSVADLAALWHLPQAHDLPDLAYVERLTMRTLLAPTILSTISGYKLGVSTHAGQTLPVFFPFACLRQNVLAAASTGKGKSSLFYHLMCAFALGRLLKRSDIPDGALLIDPHGDLVEQVAGALPPELVEEILVINLADRDYPMAFNPLDMSGEGKDRDKIIDNLILVVEALWPTSYGPRTESFLEYSCKTLAEANMTLIAADPLNGPNRQYTLLDVIPLLRQTSFRNAVLELVHDPHLLSWWRQYYELLDARQQSDFTSSLITKIAKFSSTKMISRILGQPRSSLDLNEIIRQNKIVLFSCASGEVGADMAALFGSLFVGFFQAALQEQARVHPSERHRFLVLIDEFQALAGVNYQVMLAELRKYGGSFALATQSLSYLDRFERTLRATVLANVEHIFSFAMADEDARLLRLPGIEPDDVTQLPNYACYVRLALDGTRLPVFSLHLDAPGQGDPALHQSITDRCRGRYGRPVGDVEQVLRECQARRDNGMPGTGPWAGAGVETMAEVAERIRKRRRGGGGSKKGGRDESEIEEGGVSPEHFMYDDLPPPGGTNEAGEEEV